MIELHSKLDLVYAALEGAESSARLAKEHLERAQDSVPKDEEVIHTVLGFRETDPDLEEIFRIAFAANPNRTEYYLRRLALTLRPAARARFCESLAFLKF